jgi:hypothetical protein
MIPRHVCPLIVLGVFCAVSAAAGSHEKSRYDIDARSTATADAPASVRGTGGWYGKISGTVGEIAVLSGGFFTIGTVEGTMAGTLDDKCGITFGHPFARTSYPVLCIDGSWMKPLAFFSAGSEAITGGGDSLLITYSMAGVAKLTLTYALRQDGRICTIRSELQNLDSVAHSLGLGFAFDPGLGITGDGFLTIDGKEVSNDTVIASPGAAAILFRERFTSPSGVRASLVFPDGPPDSLFVANWRDRADLDGPSHPLPNVRALYDIDLFTHWRQTEVAAGAVIRNAISVRQDASDFGNGVFLRWDIPDHSEIADGVMFPATIPTTVSVANLSSVPKTGTLKIAASSGIAFDPASRAVTIPAASRVYPGSSALIEELYQETVVRVVASWREGGGAGDSVVRFFLIPATPVADTGLVVAIDSLDTHAFPEVDAFITVKRASTGQYVVQLAPKNLVITDNGVGAGATSVRTDTTSGVTMTDIVFVLDVTGSMTGAITGVKNSILAFADSMAEAGMAYRLGLVTFLDEIENIYPFTPDAAVFKGYVGAQYAHGGDDDPENSLDALDTTCTLPWDPDARHVVVWITDITYHITDWATPRTREQVLTHLLEKNITVFALGPPWYQTDWYNPIAVPTGGKYYDYSGKYLDILVDIAFSKTSVRKVVTYRAPTSTPGTHALSMGVRYGGRGGTATSTYAIAAASPVEIGLTNFPNPFNPSTTIRVTGPDLAGAAVVIYDCLGREIQRTLIPPGTGTRDIVWDARDVHGHEVSSGVYFVRVQFTALSGEPLGSSAIKILHLR